MNNWNQLADNARIWLYGANRSLTESEESQILLILDRFCDEWAAHGAKLNCGFQILHHQIIVLGVDEASAAASGCSIDSSVKVFRDIDAQFQLDLFNRLRSYHIADNTINALDSSSIKSKVEAVELQADSRFIDMLITSKGDVRNALVKPMSQTWLSKYL